MIRRQGLAHLDAVVVTRASQAVKFDGFKFISKIEIDNIYPPSQGAVTITAIDQSSPESEG